MDEYEAYIDQLPQKITEMLESLDEEPTEEETLAINEAHAEVKSNIQQVKQEIDEYLEHMRKLSERLKNDPNADAEALVAEILQLYHIESPCGAASMSSNFGASNETINSNGTNETNKSDKSNLSNENNESYYISDETKKSKNSKDIEATETIDKIRALSIQEKELPISLP